MNNQDFTFTVHDQIAATTTTAVTMVEEDNSSIYQSSYGNRLYSDNWMECYTDEGNVYYYNQITGESSWVLPDGVYEITQLVKQMKSSGKSKSNNSNAISNVPMLDYGGSEYSYTNEEQEYYEGYNNNNSSSYPFTRTIWTSEPTPTVGEYILEETTKRRNVLMSTIEKWTTLVNEVKATISSHRKNFLMTREELFTKATAQVRYLFIVIFAYTHYVYYV